MEQYIVNTLNKKSKINKEIYGHFSEHLGRCIYEGLYVGENSDIPNVNGMRTDVVEALKKMKLPVLRWPGGCFADEYHWKDGIGEKSTRKKMINTHWGGVVEDNSFGTHEFMELCRQVGCEPYITGNVGSGTVQEMQEWVEYMTFDGVSPMAELRKANGQEKPWHLKYFGVGNENWGCGGNMRPEYYADVYRRYQTYVRNFGDNKIFKVACGPSENDYNWTDVFMKNAGRYCQGLALHYYTSSTGTLRVKGSATEFDGSEWYSTLKNTLFMKELIEKHTAIMRKYDPEGKVGLVVDEWGTWYKVEPGTNPGFLYQQNTVRDAVVAAINLNLFNKYSDRVIMANIAQLVNVLQSVILTDGADMILTPTYHVFEMFKAHQEATLVDSFIKTKEVGLDENTTVPNISESVSVAEDGTYTITMANLSLDEDYEIDTQFIGDKPTSAQGRVLTGAMNAHNTFEAPETVSPVALNVAVTESGLQFKLPARSVVSITVKA